MMASIATPPPAPRVFTIEEARQRALESITYLPVLGRWKSHEQADRVGSGMPRVFRATALVMGPLYRGVPPGPLSPFLDRLPLPARAP